MTGWVPRLSCVNDSGAGYMCCVSDGWLGLFGLKWTSQAKRSASGSRPVLDQPPIAAH